jgi:uncharacterized protein (DUF1697 family)
VEEYLAFLRAINLGAHNPIKMATLKEILTRQGAVAVRTYLQSGNVLFHCAPEDLRAVVAGAEAELAELLGDEVPITTRPLNLVQDWIAENPFSGAGVQPGDKEYVTFLYAEPQRPVALPLASERGDLLVFASRRGDLFSLSRRVGGQYGFPNAFIEKELGVVATSRKWTTVERLVAKYGQDWRR